ncbi:selenium metabolism-associated LysR family transcriptional regulator [Desulfovibrio ferrophilus]|uniref:Transcriptional regulator, LysR family n=1 Tax=Desulfovibrio ferrophilus TaxID=241368 RepID=A0A2Z6AV86_9BACT|nr:selenium metabolism-associated LysR family transcriptional regulator [Desulfovibrio ferrophilus]BBD07144.1 transcriptional regulator, LysR family [Desulfovibrio ferrophilus]
MDIRRLEAFSKVYELRSFSKAGEELYLSQPTISAHVSALETELDVRLFDRLGRTILPTQAAEVLYRYALDVFNSLAAAEAEIQLLQERVAGDLIIGGSTIPAHYVLPSLLARFSSRYPEVRMDLKVADSTKIIQRLIGGEGMVGMVGAREDHPDLTFEKVLMDELVIVGSPPLASRTKQPLIPAELASLPWIMREEGSGTRRAFETALDAQGAPRPQPVLKVESTLAALQSVLAGIGVTVTSRLAARPLLKTGEIVEIQVNGLDMQRDFYLAYHSRRHLFPAARYFIEFIRQECRLGA